MKVQVTKSQFIETDDISFAEQDELDENVTKVWLRNAGAVVVVRVYVDYDQFVWRLNSAIPVQQVVITS